MRATFVKDITGIDFEEDKERGLEASSFGGDPALLYKLPEPIYIFHSTSFPMSGSYHVSDLSKPGAIGERRVEYGGGQEVECATQYFVISLMGGKLHGITYKPGEHENVEKYVGLKKRRAKKYAEYYELRKHAHILEIQFLNWSVCVFPAHPDGRCMCVGAHICDFEEADTMKEGIEIALDLLEKYAKESEPAFLFE